MVFRLFAFDLLGRSLSHFLYMTLDNGSRILRLYVATTVFERRTKEELCSRGLAILYCQPFFLSLFLLLFHEKTVGQFD
jgi:hypothetical protein